MSSGGLGPTIDPIRSGISGSVVTDGPRDSGAAAVDHPKQIGPYTILSVLGEGGMGIVYIAEQRQPVHRRVALKLIKLGMDTREVIARFEAERQALALMDHPNIARVFEAGATDTGRPYFVMELVSGMAITRFCDEHKMSNRSRLELFATVCDAVQHAHSKGVIHRDIKPGNILVAEVDGKPVAKVIDFGIAKATNQRLTERTLFTEMGRMVGTPEYMSPEQAASTPLDIDTRTDVYSLGVLLYELLTGTLPFDPQSLRSGAYNEIQRIIREVEPPRPSTRLGKLDAREATARALCRQESLVSLSSALRRELEWIPLKAMRKEREHRYRTASEMADDVRNYLLGRPLIAGPETRAYRARKFLRRNRGGVTVAAVMLALLVGGIVATTYQAIRATRAEQQAQQRFNDVRALASGLILDLHPQIERLGGSSGAQRQLADLSVRYLKKLAAQSSNDPALLRDIAIAYEKLGDIQGNPNTPNRGDISGARESYRLSLQAAEAGLAIPSLSEADRRKLSTALAAATLKTGDVLLADHKPDDALAHFRRAHAIFGQLAGTNRDQLPPRFNEIVCLPRIERTQLQLGDVTGAIETARQEVALAQALVKDFPAEQYAKEVLATAYGNVSLAHVRAGKYADAIEATQRSLEIKRGIADAAPDDAKAKLALTRGYVALADALDVGGKLDDAVEAREQAVLFARHAVNLDPLDLSARAVLGQVLMRGGDFATDKGDYDRAAGLYQEAIKVYQKTLQIAPQSSGATEMLSVTYGQLAMMERVRERYDASIAAHQAGIDLLMPLVQAAPTNHRLRGGLSYALRNLATALRKADRLDEALANARRAMELELQIAKDAPQDDRAARNRLYAQVELADVLIAVANQPDRAVDRRQRDREEARTLLGKCLTEYEARLAAGTTARADAEMVDTVKQKLASLDAPATAPAAAPTSLPTSEPNVR